MLFNRRISTAWYIRFPGSFYALGPVRFERPVGERVLRDVTRKWAQVDRLPRGFECWPTND